MPDTPTHDPWEVFDHESNMFEGLYKVLLDQAAWLMQQPKLVIYAIFEANLFHARVLCELLLSDTRYTDNVKLSEMLPGFTPKRLDDLRRAYYDEGICMTINKRLMHPTAQRTAGYNWAPELETLRPILEDIIAEVNTQRPRATGA